MKMIFLEDDELYEKLKGDIKSIVLEAFLELLDKKMFEKNTKSIKKYCNTEEAKKILDVGTTTLQDLRNDPDNLIRTFKPAGKIKLLYDVQSLYDFIESREQK